MQSSNCVYEVDWFQSVRVLGNSDWLGRGAGGGLGILISAISRWEERARPTTRSTSPRDQGVEPGFYLPKTQGLVLMLRTDADSEIDAGIGDIDWAGKALSAGGAIAIATTPLDYR